MHDEIITQFGHRIKSLRLAKGFSQEQLADRAFLHRTYIGMIERGEKNLTLKNIYRLAKALEVDVKELF